MSTRRSADLHYRRLERMYHSAPINQSIPSCMTVSDGHAEVHMRVTRDYWHSAGAMHGSLYFKGLDDAAFFAANSAVQDFFVLTAKFEVELLGRVDCQSVRAVGFLERREGRKIWARSELYDDADQLVARGSGLFIIGQIALDESVGYFDSGSPP
jgi:acyl-coenzyme A thioesterase PaaI-like protein